jgi:hypothetical protein
MKINISFLLLLLFAYAPVAFSLNQHDQKNTRSFVFIKKTKSDKKPKFIPKRMTDAEQQNLAAFIKQKLYVAEKEKNEQLIKKYESMEAVLAQLIPGNLAMTNVKDEKIYTEYFNLIIAELESLGESPQLILHTNNLRQKLLEGKLENTPWFVKEIGGLDWLFEQDTKQAAWTIEQTHNDLQFLDSTQSAWPKLEDKALYVMSLVDQIERNHQRLATEDLAIIIEICQEYLISFLPNMSNVFKRTIQEAINKLEKVRNIRDIPSLKE